MKMVTRAHVVGHFLFEFGGLVFWWMGHGKLYHREPGKWC